MSGSLSTDTCAMTPIYVSSVALVACGMAYIDTLDTHMCVHVEVRGHQLMGFRCHSQCFLRHGLSLAWNLFSRLGWSASEPQGSTPLCLFHAGVTSEHIASDFLHVGSETWAQSLSQHFVNWANLLVPGSAIFCRFLPTFLTHFDLS